MKELNAIQCRLSAPKDLYNKFGEFKYRSLESILQAVKPLLAETKCTIVFSDEMILVGSRYYVKSTCTIRNEAGEVETSVGNAREQESKKGMDEAQITGSASSYARKYAVCSLLGVDDNRDPDMMDNSEEGAKPKPHQPERRQPARPTVEDKIRQTPAKTAEDGGRYTVTLEDVDGGKCRSMVEYMSHQDHEDLVVWEAAKQILKDKYDFNEDAMDKIEKLATAKYAEVKGSKAGAKA